VFEKLCSQDARFEEIIICFIKAFRNENYRAMESWLRDTLKQRGYDVWRGNFHIELNDKCRTVGLVDETVGYSASIKKVELSDSKNVQIFNLGACSKTVYRKMFWGELQIRTAQRPFTISEFKEDVLEFLGDDGLPRPVVNVNQNPRARVYVGRPFIVVPQVVPVERDNAEEYLSSESGDSYDSEDVSEYEQYESSQFESEAVVDPMDEEVMDDVAKEDIPSEPSKECAVCLEELSRRIVFVPCGHANCCPTCSPKLRECPTCRRQIAQRIKVFL
jgi:hypothetical protein